MLCEYCVPKMSFGYPEIHFNISFKFDFKLLILFLNYSFIKTSIINITLELLVIFSKYLL